MLLEIVSIRRSRYLYGLIGIGTGVVGIGGVKTTILERFLSRRFKGRGRLFRGRDDLNIKRIGRETCIV
jgi:hypothetical protein